MILRRMIGCRRGVAAIEFALIGLVLISLTVAAFEFGRALFVKHQLSRLADAATRDLLLNPGLSNADVESGIVGGFTAGTASNVSVTFGVETVRSTTYRTLDISYPVQLLVPNLAASSVTVSVSRRVPQF